MIYAYMTGKRTDGKPAQAMTDRRGRTCEIKAGGAIETIIEVEGVGRITFKVWDDGSYNVHHSPEGQPRPFFAVHSGIIEKENL